MKMVSMIVPIQSARSFELKYCERCGNLGIRSCGSRKTLCPPCATAEAVGLPDAPVSFLRLFSRLRAEVQA
jgi:formylmethanofuran dehydrogenase subunit E